MRRNRKCSLLYCQQVQQFRLKYSEDIILLEIFSYTFSYTMKFLWLRVPIDVFTLLSEKPFSSALLRQGCFVNQNFAVREASSHSSHLKLGQPKLISIRHFKREFTHSTSRVRARVKFESSSSHEPSSSQGPSFYFSIFFLLFISSGCYFRLHNDVLVAHRKNYNCLVCNVLRYRSLEPSGTIYRYHSLPSVAVQRYTASLSVSDRLLSVFMNFLRRLRPVFAYTWSRDSISASGGWESARWRTLPLLKRHLVYVHRTPKIKFYTSRTYSLRGHNVDSHVIFRSNTAARFS